MVTTLLKSSVRRAWPRGGSAFEWNVLNYGRITTMSSPGARPLQQYLINYQNTVLKAQKEVQDGIPSFVHSAVVAFLRKSVDAAKGALKIATLNISKAPETPRPCCLQSGSPGGKQSGGGHWRSLLGPDNVWRARRGMANPE